MPRGNNDFLIVVAILVALWWATTKGGIVTPPAPVVKATSATFVFEKDSHVVPGPVSVALNKLNRERGIVATLFEDDSVDGTGEIPEQYKIPLAAAREAGLPTLVVMAGKDVLRVVKNPKSEAEVLEAVQ